MATNSYEAGGILLRNCILSLVIGIGIIFCGGIAGAEGLEYIDNMEITDSFSNDGLAYRISESNIRNHADSAVRKHGDSNVIYGSTNNAEVVYKAEAGYELAVTVYISQNVLAEDIFALEFSADRQEWVTSNTSIAEYLLDNNNENVSGESYRAAILKAKVPEGCRYARVRWISSAWNYMLGEVEHRKAVNYGDFYDDLIDFKKVSATSLYLRKYTLGLTDGLDKSAVQRTPYYCGQKHEFSADSAVVGKYGEYSPAQYLVYDLNPNQKNSVCVDVQYADNIYILQMPFALYVKADGDWKKADTKLRINGNRASYYIENTGFGAEKLKIVFPLEADRVGANITGVTVRPSGGIKAEVSELAYFVDGERVFSTPADYGESVVITGVLSAESNKKLVNPKMIIAAYDENGKIVAVGSSRLLNELARGEKSVFTVELADLNYKAKKVKLFFWEDNEPVALCAEDVVHKPEEFKVASGTLTDSFEDFSKIWEISSGWIIEDSDGKKVPGYSKVIRRDYNLKRAIKYRVHNAKSITINAFRFRKIGDIRIYTSGYDGGYKEVTSVFSGNRHTADDWWTANYEVASLPENTSYIKIEIDKGIGPNWTPVIAQVSINY